MKELLVLSILSVNWLMKRLPNRVLAFVCTFHQYKDNNLIEIKNKHMNQYNLKYKASFLHWYLLVY